MTWSGPPFPAVFKRLKVFVEDGLLCFDGSLPVGCLFEEVRVPGEVVDGDVRADGVDEALKECLTLLEVRGRQLLVEPVRDDGGLGIGLVDRVAAAHVLEVRVELVAVQGVLTLQKVEGLPGAFVLELLLEFDIVVPEFQKDTADVLLVDDEVAVERLSVPLADRLHELVPGNGVGIFAAEDLIEGLPFIPGQGRYTGDLSGAVPGVDR